MKKIITLFIVFIVAFTNAQNIDVKKIDAIVDSKIGEKDPSLFVGIVKDGNIVYEKYRGLANLQHQVKTDSKTRSNIASTAKQFTALMVLQLSLEEKLKLDDDIRKYLPRLYPAIKEKIRIRHLLNHTSGIRDYADLLSIQQKPWWRQVGMDNDDVIELLEKQEDLGFAPGSRYMYSNSGYTLLTKIIEVVSGKKFHDYSQNFFKNLGMVNTTFLKDYMYVIPNQALPYSDWGDGVWQQYPMITNLYGDGFLFTTLKDQLIFEQAVQNAKFNNNRLLIESQKPIPNSEIKTYGFGLELEDRLNYKSVHHSGGTGSYHSQTIRFPDEKLTLFVMSNNSKLWSGRIADEIANTILLKKEAVVSYDNDIKKIQQKTSLKSLVGQYRSPKGTIIRIQLKEGKIYWKMDNNNPFELQHEKDNLYSIIGNSSTKIGFRINKEMTVFWPDSDKRVYKKIDSFQPTKPELETYEGEYYSSELEISFNIELNRQGKLMIWMGDREKPGTVEVINKNDLLFSDYRMKVERDIFNRVTGILITTNRVLNNRFTKKTKLQFQPKISTANGSINVTTIGSRDGNSSQILLTKNYPNGNEIWSQQFGGKSYDKASSIMATEDGYIIVGSTSSYGKENYNMYVIKTDKKGKKIWQNAYGGFYNEYGYAVEKTNTGYLIKGTIQKCTSNSDVFNRKCTTNVWFVSIDENGKEISNQVLEEIK
jgi:CubicO group peptidase (beta-lactamase class C family)